jgi:hypothetical protein
MKRRGARPAAAQGLTESSASAASSVASDPLEQPAKEVMRTVRALLKEGCGLSATHSPPLPASRPALVRPAQLRAGGDETLCAILSRPARLTTSRTAYVPMQAHARDAH